MIQAGLWRDHPVRRRRVFQLRERCVAVGELVQIDGSPHAWLEDRGLRCTLIIFVDDATSALQWARFEPAETTRAYLREYVTQRGVPLALPSRSRRRRHAQCLWPWALPMGASAPQRHRCTW
jgi:hypothetical protein